MGRQLLLNGLEQALIHDRRLLSGQDLTPVFDLANKEPVPKEVGEGSSSERDASTGLARAEGPCPGADVSGPEVPDKFVDAGYSQISAKDHPDPFGFVLDDGEVAVLQPIAEGEGPPTTAHRRLLHRSPSNDKLQQVQGRAVKETALPKVTGGKRSEIMRPPGRSDCFCDRCW